MPPKGDPLLGEGDRGPGEVDRRGAAVGDGVQLQAGDVRRAAQAAAVDAAGREARAASTRSTASSTPTSRRTRSTPPAAARRRRVRPPRLPRPDRPAAGRRASSRRSWPTRTPTSARSSSASCSPRTAAYAEHWLTFWNDLLRNDYAGTGYIDGGRKQITALALPVAAREQAVRPVRPRADQPDAGVGGLHQGHQVARRGQRQPGRRAAVRAERRRRCSSAST